MSENPPPPTPLSDNPLPIIPSPYNPPPPTPTERPSSPASSTISWASSLIPPTPSDVFSTPFEHNGLASLLERESALLQALQELESERAQVAQEKAALEQEQEITKRERRNLQSFQANLVREKIDQMAKKRCSTPTWKDGNAELWEMVAVGAAVVVLASCVIPGFFALMTVIQLQAVASRKVSLWVLGKFGL